MPIISIIVPLYNHEQFIGELISSLASYKNKYHLQVVIIDDCSNDDSFAVAEQALKNTDLDFILLRNKHNLGVLKTLNRCLEHAVGDFIIPCASDDIIIPEALDERIEQLSSHPGAIAHFGRVQIINSDSESIDFPIHNYEDYITETFNVSSNIEFARRFILKWRLIGPGYCFSRSLYENFGHYNPALKHEDWELFLRIIHSGDFVVSKKVVGKYRIHDNNFHKKCPISSTLEQLRITIKYLLRLDKRYSATLAKRTLSLLRVLRIYSRDNIKRKLSIHKDN